MLRKIIFSSFPFHFLGGKKGGGGGGGGNVEGSFQVFTKYQDVQNKTKCKTPDQMHFIIFNYVAS